MNNYLKKIFCPLVLLLLAFGLAQAGEILPGDRRIPEYIGLLGGKRVGILTNHTGLVEGTHIVDTLVKSGINVSVIFAPEHGFRGNKSAGEQVGSGRDANTGLEVISLYGSNRIPRRNDVFKTDVIVVDIQDVGLRFYTYLSTMYYIMQVCAEVGVPMIVLDRPNPNGMYVDGPLLDTAYRSFVGMIPIPVVHGMTLGELARMINGEGWLAGGIKCKLTVVPCLNYRRSMRYRLPVPPSPNLPDMRAVYLYPSLCLFEATPVSIGRGTDFPFEVIGHPSMNGDFVFTPHSREGAVKPPLEGVECKGLDLRELPPTDSIICKGLDLSYLIDAYNQLGMGDKFFTPTFERLIGVSYVRDMILSGYSAEEIESRWKTDVEAFKQKRQKYLIYED